MAEHEFNLQPLTANAVRDQSLDVDTGRPSVKEAHDLHIDEHLITAVLQASLAAVVIADARGNILEFNPTAERIFGWSRAEVLHQPMSKTIIPPRHHAAHQHGMERYLSTRVGHILNKRIEIVAMRADGSEFPVELTVVPTTSGGRDVFVAFIEDITLRKQGEQQLLYTTSRLKQLINSLHGGILLENEHRHIELVNDAFCRMFGIETEPAALIGTDCSTSAEDTRDMFADPEGFATRIGALLQAQELVIGDELHLKNGKVYKRDYIPIFVDAVYAGHLWHYQDVTEDVRARERAKRLLKLEQLQNTIVRMFLLSDDLDVVLNEFLGLTGQLLDVSRAYVFHFRRNERILDNSHEWCAPGVNPEIDNLKGLPFDELVPSFFPLLVENGSIAPYHISELPEDIGAMLKPQGIESVLILPLYADDRVEGFIGYDDVRHPRKWLPEEISTIRLIAQSYSRALERKRAQDMLVEARDAALRVAQLRSQFVANMSHEIRTPMTGIMGMLQILLETPLEADQLEYAAEAYNSASRLLGVINDVLDFSKLESGRFVLLSEPIDVGAIALEVKMTLKPQYITKGLDFDLNVAPDVPQRVLGDATRIRQVLMNLVGNAIKFTKQGSIKINLSRVKLVGNVAWLRFEVTDTGIGISSAQIDRIFESFVQVDGTTTRKYGGTGLGLAISKQLVELMGGTLEVESTPSKGSVFRFTLGLPVDAHYADSNHHLPGFDKLHVLVLDDEKTGRYVLTQQLTNWNVNVTELNSTAELELALLQASKHHPYDVVFLRHKANKADLSIMSRLCAAAASGNIHLIALLTDTPLETQSDDGFVVPMPHPLRQSDLYNLLVLADSQREQSMFSQPESTQTASNPISVTKGRVLVAEDYPVSANIIIRTLMGLGIEVDVVTNGQDALIALDEKPYDLVLMDIQMPVMDGKDATKRIRASNAVYRNIPIIAVTASVMHDELEDYQRIGITEILTKPFSVVELRERVLGWLGNKPS